MGQHHLGLLMKKKNPPDATRSQVKLKLSMAVFARLMNRRDRAHTSLAKRVVALEKLVDDIGRAVFADNG